MDWRSFLRLKYVDVSMHNPLVRNNRVITPRKRSGLNLYEIVVIKSLATGKKHRVQVETKGRSSLGKKLAVLNAIDQVVDELVKGRVTPFLYAAGQIFEDSRNFDEFVDSLESQLKIKAKILK